MFFAGPKETEVKIVEGKTRTFHCPGEDVHWYNSDTLSSKVDDNDPNTLVLSSITLADDGAQYVCKDGKKLVIQAIKVKVIPSKN